MSFSTLTTALQKETKTPPYWDGGTRHIFTCLSEQRAQPLMYPLPPDTEGCYDVVLPLLVKAGTACQSRTLMKTEARPSPSLIPEPLQTSSPITDAHSYDVLSESLIPLANYYLLIPAVSCEALLPPRCLP